MSNTDKKISPQERYAIKNGLVSKSYKISRETADAFQEACKKAGVSMSTQLTAMMQDFIHRVNEEKK